MIPPLPKGVRDLVEHNTHPGLALDKYLDSWFGTDDGGEKHPKDARGDASGKEDRDQKHQEKVQKPTLERVVCRSTTQPKELDYQALFDRREQALAEVGGLSWRCRAAGPLTLHLARASALENAGICLHPLYGFVYLPGSGLKGLARAYAETVWLKGQADKATAWRLIEAVFGWAPGSDKGKDYKPADAPNHGKEDNAAAGAIVFHDAWPCTWPKLVLDIVNNHHPRYYKGEDAPGDWENPVPVYFLAVPAGQDFSFALSKRSPGVGDDLPKLARDWLNGGLAHLGVGAKTNAGYGAMRPIDEPVPDLPASTLATFEATLELVTPAFLAGASQGKEDCDLRPATLRGVLRWWWRTLYAGMLDVKTLRALEAAIWGDTNAGGAVRIEISPSGMSIPQLYTFKDRFAPKPAFQAQHHLERPPNAKTTQGLFYVSYGMDDGGKQRYFIGPGAKWKVRLLARAAHISGRIFAASEVLDQAKAALWLLCNYGGVGSKSRKGFGCIAEPPELSDFNREKCWQITEQIGVHDQSQLVERDSPAFEGAMLVEQDTKWTDCWYALDQLGYSYQAFAKQWAHKKEKAALGLPRKIHGPRREPIGRQSVENHKPPEKLTSPKGDRFSSPFCLHLSKNEAGCYKVRVVAFPSRYLPDPSTSKQILHDLCSHVKKEIAQRSQKSGIQTQQYRTTPHTGRDHRRKR
ncbi:MAG: type III-B CRISPR module RAMP protein Cmr6 [Thermodesulfobacteriota bacterium]